MFWHAILLVSVTKYVALQNPILSPKFSDVIENSSLEIMCNVRKNPNITQWSTSNSNYKLSSLRFSIEGICEIEGFLNDTQYFETSCYSNGTHKVKIKRVTISNHDQEWYCIQGYEKDTAKIYVQVPIKFVKIGQVFGSVLRAVENIKTTINCMTSEGRPDASITWTQLSKKGIKTDLTHTAVYNISEKDNGMIISQSSINLRPLRRDNDTRIICEATNKISNITRREVTLHVQYPSRILQFSASGKEMKKGHFEVTENETIHFTCSVDSNLVSLILLSFKEQYLWRDVSKGLIYTHRVESCFDDGVYTCSTSNTYYIKASKEELTLHVRCTPLLSPDFELTTNITSAQHVSVTFQFKSIAYPEPTFEWCKFIDLYCKTLNNDKKFEITTHGLYSSLTIQDISEDDYGRYKLKIYNPVGSLEQFYFLKANGKPDPPTLFKYLAGDIAGKSIIVQWKPGFNGGPKQTFILRYKLESGNNWTRVFIPDVGDKIMNYTLSDLKSDSVYFSELFSLNSEGQSMTRNLTFKTKEFQKLTATSLHYLKLILYCCGGVVGIVAVLVGTCFIVKRRKKQSTLKVIYQNVPPSVPDTENIYQNMPSCRWLDTTV